MTASCMDNCRPSSIGDNNPETIQVEMPACLEDAAGSTMDRLNWYKEVLKVDPTSYISFLAAEELCAKGLWEEAIEMCRRGLTFHPSHLRGRVLLGQALWETGRCEEAEATLLAAREDLEKNVKTFLGVMESARNQGDISFAEKLRISYEVSQPGQVEATIDPESFYRALEQAALPNLESEEQEIPEEIQPEGSEGEAVELEEVVVAAAPEPPFITFLTALLERYEQRPVGTGPEPQAIFSETERRLLKTILARALH